MQQNTHQVCMGHLGMQLILQTALKDHQKILIKWIALTQKKHC